MNTEKINTNDNSGSVETVQTSRHENLAQQNGPQHV